LTCGPPVGWRAIGGAALGGAQSRLKSGLSTKNSLIFTLPRLLQVVATDPTIYLTLAGTARTGRGAPDLLLCGGASSTDKPVLRWRSLLHCLCPSRNQVQVAAMLVLSGCVTRGVRHHRVLETDPGCVVIAVLW
jgi:hypothetical protein